MLRILFIIPLLIGCLIAQTNWETKFETSNYLETSNYEETIKYFERLAESPYAELHEFGLSPQGRKLYYLIVSKDKQFDVSGVKNLEKPIVLIQNGIHSGEIEGKDACMLLLRDILVTKSKEYLIDNLVLLVIPVFNVDGHERRSPYNRINQTGPKEMGWRVTAQNLNLNRDYVKADTPEMKSFLKLFSAWLPDLFIDTHTTNGLDYQYTITYSIETHQNMPPKTSSWIESELIPNFTKTVESNGYLVSKYVGIVDGNINKGVRDWVAGPRFSNGYAAAQNRPGLLIETHVLKPYKDRVFSTMHLIEGALEKVNEDWQKLLSINHQADIWAVNEYAENKKPFPISFKTGKDFKVFSFKGIENLPKYSEIAGDTIPFYTGKKITLEIPYYNKAEVIESVTVPEGYLIPSEWSELIDILKLHGINISKLDYDQKFSVEKLKFKNVKFAEAPYEGRFRVGFEYDTLMDTLLIPKGTFFIDAHQRSIGLILHLLEPDAPDSFVKWGFLNQIFEYKEYFEVYSMEPIAEKMAKEEDELYNEFRERVNNDEEFKKSARARLNFFYERSNYYDEKYMMYPILRVIEN